MTRVLSAGRPLQDDALGRMRAGFGVDFSSVRVHAEPHDAAVADAFGARAFALGSHLVFGQDAYSPATPAGRHLIAHELAHTLQPSSGASVIRRQEPERAEPAAPSADDRMHEILCGRGGAGLFGRTKVGDIFELGGIVYADPVEDTVTLLIDTRKPHRMPDTYAKGHKVDEWVIADIEPKRVVFLNRCGVQEYLYVDGEPAPAPPVTAPPATTPSRAEQEQETVDFMDFGAVVQTVDKPDGGKVVEYADGTVEFYTAGKPDSAQVTYRREMDKGRAIYVQYAQNGARTGSTVELETLESTFGVTLKRR